MELPTHLSNHLIKEYKFHETFKKSNQPNILISSYYHDKNQYPLLMHSHDYFEINIITEGNGRHFIENSYCDIKKGTVFVIPPHIKHGYCTSKEECLEIFHLALSNEFMSKFYEEIHTLHMYSSLFEIEPKLREHSTDKIFFLLCDDELTSLKHDLDLLIKYENYNYRSIETLKSSRALSIICTLTYSLSKQNINNDNSYSFLSVFNDTLEYIQNNYAEKLNMQDLSKKCGMSISTFTRYFKKIYNLTPIQYITMIRIQASKKLLINLNNSLTYIANECGFFDLTHFELFFKKLEGMTPSQYRKKLFNN